MYLDTRGMLIPFRAYNVRRREPRYIYSTTVSAAALFAFRAVRYARDMPRHKYGRNVSAGVWRAASGRNGCD